MIVVAGGAALALVLGSDGDDDTKTATSTTSSQSTTTATTTESDDTSTSTTTTTSGSGSGTVVYEVTGNAFLILYTGEGGEQVTESTPTTPWSKTFDDLEPPLQLSAISVDGSEVTCSIKVDGKTVAEDNSGLPVCIDMGS